MIGPSFLIEVCMIQVAIRQRVSSITFFRSGDSMPPSPCAFKAKSFHYLQKHFWVYTTGRVKMAKRGQFCLADPDTVVTQEHTQAGDGTGLRPFLPVKRQPRSLLCAARGISFHAVAPCLRECTQRPLPAGCPPQYDRLLPQCHSPAK